MLMGFMKISNQKIHIISILEGEVTTNHTEFILNKIPGNFPSLQKVGETKI